MCVWDLRCSGGGAWRETSRITRCDSMAAVRKLLAWCVHSRETPGATIRLALGFESFADAGAFGTKLNQDRESSVEGRVAPLFLERTGELEHSPGAKIAAGALQRMCAEPCGARV